MIGPGLFNGYYDDPHLTDQAHIIINGERYFKTGELARYNSNGDLVRLGHIQCSSGDTLKGSPRSLLSHMTKLSVDTDSYDSIRQQETENTSHDFNQSLHQPLSSLDSPLSQTFPLDENCRFAETQDFLSLRQKDPEEIEGGYRRQPFPGFVDKSFFCLRQTTPIRRQCLQLITWPWFGRITIFIILINCITLAMFQPCQQKCDTVRCLWATIADHFIFAFFVVEMCVKMIAMGVIGKDTYLADAWNRLDCFIVVTGFD